MSERINNLFKPNTHYLTDGGLETSLIYNQGVSLNHFAAFELLQSSIGKNQLKEYYAPYLKYASNKKIPFILETPTWRANSDWGYKLGYTNEEIFAINKSAGKFMRALASDYKNTIDIIISGNIGPRGDGYVVENKMTEKEACNYHYNQIKAFALADTDLVTALTLNYVEEAIGIVNAAQKVNIPVVISFTVELDGKLPSGQSLRDSIIEVDKETNGYTNHFMINCAHPNHFKKVVSSNENWLSRIKGIRANASAKSHQELDEATELDKGNKTELAKNYAELKNILPNLNVFGGCCGTDIEHIKSICNVFENN